MNNMSTSMLVQQIVPSTNSDNIQVSVEPYVPKKYENIHSGEKLLFLNNLRNEYVEILKNQIINIMDMLGSEDAKVACSIDNHQVTKIKPYGFFLHIFDDRHTSYNKINYIGKSNDIYYIKTYVLSIHRYRSININRFELHDLATLIDYFNSVYFV